MGIRTPISPPTFPSSRMVATAVLVASLACNGEPTGLEPIEVVGSWDATEAVVINSADASESMDLLALGVTISLELEPDGGATAVLGPDTETGTYSLVGNQITLVLSGDQSSGSIERRFGDRLLINLTHGVRWDFEDNGVDVPVTLRLTMTRAAS